MKKYTVTFEEHMQKAFEIEAETMEDAEEIAKQKYYNREFIVGQNMVYRCMETQEKETGFVTDWVEF